MVSIDDLDKASLLIIRNGIKQILDESPDNMLDEHLDLNGILNIVIQSQIKF